MMKKRIALLLCIVSLLTGCATGNEPTTTETTSSQTQNDFNQLLKEDTTIFGQIQNKKGDEFTIALMKDMGEFDMCPAVPGGETEDGDTAPTEETTGEGIAQSIPEDMDVTQVFLDYTGETITIVFDEGVSIAYPNGEPAGTEALSAGTVIGMILDEPGGKVIGIKLLG